MREGVMRVVKILWERCAYSGASEKMDKDSLTTDEIELSANELEKLEQLLAASAEMLPKASRTFQHWRVGLLERFDEMDIQ